MSLFSENTCENCHKRGKRKFRIHEPGITYKKNSTDEVADDHWTFCSVACAKSFAAWMLAGGKTKMPKGWKVEEIK